MQRFRGESEARKRAAAASGYTEGVGTRATYGRTQVSA